MDIASDIVRLDNVTDKQLQVTFLILVLWGHHFEHD